MPRDSFVASVVAELGRGLGIAELTLDDEGRRTLQIGDGELTLTQGSEPVDLVWLHVRIGEIDNQDRALVRYLLQAGHLLWTRNLMTIVLDDAGSAALGYNMIPVVNLNAARLRDLAIAMLKTAAELHRRIRARDFSILPAAFAGDLGSAGAGLVRV